jgi:hypothetical protein
MNPPNGIPCKKCGETLSSGDPYLSIPDTCPKCEFIYKKPKCPYTSSLESFVNAINEQGNMKARIVSSEIMDDTFHAEVEYTMIKPVENIKINFEVLK